MTRLRSQHARERARHLLNTMYPIPEQSEAERLRAVADEYIAEAERLEAEARGRSMESGELISSALDNVAKDYFRRTVLRAALRKNGERKTA